ARGASSPRSPPCASAAAPRRCATSRRVASRCASRRPSRGRSTPTSSPRRAASSSTRAPRCASSCRSPTGAQPPPAREREQGREQAQAGGGQGGTATGGGGSEVGSSAGRGEEGLRAERRERARGRAAGPRHDVGDLHGSGRVPSLAQISQPWAGLQPRKTNLAREGLESRRRRRSLSGGTRKIKAEVVPRDGFEPPFAGSEPAVLPLDDRGTRADWIPERPGFLNRGAAQPWRRKWIASAMRPTERRAPST